VRTKIGGLMFVTITHSPKPVLDVHYGSLLNRYI
jgi:hypothetical protein